MHIVLTAQLLQGTLDYLSTRPYREVAPLIETLQRQAQDAGLQALIAPPAAPVETAPAPQEAEHA